MLEAQAVRRALTSTTVVTSRLNEIKNTEIHCDGHGAG